jgi:predicted RNase H-like HicB family nuclease
MKIRVVVEYDPEAKAYAAFCPELPGCTSCGDTEADALRNIREAIALYLEPTPVQVGPSGKVVEVTV